MAGTIPLSMSQQFDEFGKPLSGGLLYIYQAGTVATPQNPYQDYGLTILQPNPIVLDAAGRVPQFFLADGFIKIRLTNKDGLTQIARDGILVIGPSSGSGGGGGVDPTTLIQMGNMILRYGVGILSGYVRLNNMTIGSSTSGATERANADCQALWQYLYGVDSTLVVSGGRTGNALNDWNANKQLTLPDWRGYGFSALDDMGNVAAGRLTATYFGASAIVLGAFGGDEKNLLGTTHIPAHQHPNTVSGAGSHSHPLGDAALYYANVGIAGSGFNAVFFGNPAGSGTLINANTTAAGAGVSIVNKDNTGGGNAHANVQPTKLCSVYIKL